MSHLNKSVIETSEAQCPAISSDCTNLANTDLVPGFTDSVSDETYPPTSHEQSTLPNEQANSSSYGKEEIDPLQATPAQVANFLSVEFGANKSYSTLNLYRVFSTFSLLHQVWLFQEHCKSLAVATEPV